MVSTPTPAPRRGMVTWDWFYVRYRTVAVAAVVGVALCAGVGWWWFTGGASAEERALEAIGDARNAVAGARAAGGYPEPLKQAEEHLARALGALDRAEYEQAITEADAAEMLAGTLLARAEVSEATVRIVRIDGDVRVKRLGQFLWESARERAVLGTGDQIRTGDDGMVQLVYFDGTVTTIRSSSLLEIRTAERPSDTTQAQKVSERLAWGTVDTTTQGNPDRRSIHEVSTESGAASAETAAEFQVQHDRERGRSEIIAWKGEITFKGAEGEERIVENTRVTVFDGQIVDRKDVLGSPRLVAPADQKTYLGPGDTSISLAWRPLEGAQSYSVQLSDKPLFSQILFTMRESGGSSVVMPPLAAGSYYWRVAGIDVDSVSGRWSETRKFRILGSEFHDFEDATPPELKVSETQVIGSNAIIIGHSEPGARLWIGEEREPVDVKDDGSFRWLIKLQRDGWNEVPVISQDAAGNETRIELKVYIDVF